MGSYLKQAGFEYIVDTEYLGTLTANKATYIDNRAVYVGSAGTNGDLVYIPVGKKPYLANMRSIRALAANTFTGIGASYLIGAFSGTRALDYLQEIADTQSAGDLTGTNGDFEEGVYLVDMNITDDGVPGTVRGTYSFEIKVDATGTITSIIIQEPAFGLESADDVILPANTIGTTHDAVTFNLAGSSEVPSGSVPLSYGTDCESIAVYK
jgi:hypothetical protein